MVVQTTSLLSLSLCASSGHERPFLVTLAEKNPPARYWLDTLEGRWTAFFYCWLAQSVCMCVVCASVSVCTYEH